MFKLCVFLAIVAVAMAAPAPEPALAPGYVAAYAAPLASSSQYINRHYNGFAAAPLTYAAAPLAYGAAYAPYAASPYAAAPYAAQIVY